MGLRAVTGIKMVHMVSPVMPRSFAARWKKIQQISKVCSTDIHIHGEFKNVDLSALIATMMVQMVPAVLPRSFAAFLLSKQELFDVIGTTRAFFQTYTLKL